MIRIGTFIHLLYMNLLISFHSLFPFLLIDEWKGKKDKEDNSGNFVFVENCRCIFIG